MIGLKINKNASGEALQNRGFEAGDGNQLFLYDTKRHRIHKMLFQP